MSENIPNTETVEKSQTQTVTPEELADGNMTATKSAEPAQPVPEFDNPPERESAPCDSRGTVFDPAIHRAGPDGKPMLNKHGHFYSKTVGRKPKESAPKFSAEATTDGVPTFAGQDTYGPLAETFLAIGNGTLVSVFTEEIAQTPQDHDMLKPPLEHWLRSSEMKDLPPWAAFAMVATGVYLPKFSKPKVKERALLLFFKVKGLFGKLLGKRKKNNVEPAAEVSATVVSEDEADFS